MKDSIKSIRIFSLLTKTLLSLLVPQNSNIRPKTSTAFCHNIAQDPSLVQSRLRAQRIATPPPFSMMLTRATSSYKRDLISRISLMNHSLRVLQFARNLNIDPTSKPLPLSSIFNAIHSRTNNPSPLSITASKAMSSR
jgi:hypothetical protein